MLPESLQQELVDLRQRVAAQADQLTQAQQQMLRLQQMEHALRESHHKLSLMMERTPIAVIEWSPAFRVVNWNPTAETIFGYCKDEAIDRHVTELIVPEQSKADVNQRISAFLRQPEGIRSIHKNCTKDGRVITCEWFNAPLTTLNGDVLGVISMVQAIGNTSADASPPANEQALPLPPVSQSFLSAIINTTADPLFVKDQLHRYVVLNDAFCDFMQWQRSDVIGRTDHHIFPEAAQADFFHTTDELVLSTGLDREDEETITNMNGVTRIFSTKKTCLSSPDGQKFLVGTMRDITALKQAEAALKQAKEELETKVAERTGELQQTVSQLQQEISDRQAALREREQAEAKLQHTRKFLESVLKTLPVAVVAKDAKELRYILWNRAAEEVLGRSAKEMLGKNAFDLLPQAAASDVMTRDRRVLTSKRIVNIPEEVVELPNGTVRILHTKKTAVLDEDGKPQYLLAITEDITDRKQAEVALQQNEAQLRELAQREELLNRIANQIRSSLDLDTILGTVVQEIRSLLQIDRCTFCWYSTHSDTLASLNFTHEDRDPDLSSILGTYPINLEQPTDRYNPIVESVINQTPYRIDDVATAPNLRPEARAVLMTYGYTSELLLPIQTRSGQLGVIHCGQHRCIRAWSDAEVDLLQALASQLTIAINQAELYKQSRTAATTAQMQAQKLEQALQDLQQAQAQMVQSEKMSSLGQLVAGVAHEINNPVNFIYGNLNYANEYTQDLLTLVNLYQRHYPNPVTEIQDVAQAIDLDFLMQDLPKLLSSMKVGADRIQKIVASLRTFSRMDEAEFKAVDLHDGIDSTLMILQNRLKAKQVRIGDIEYSRPDIEIIKDYGNLPLVECYAGQLNQVFMNILSNAVDALEERDAQRSTEDMQTHPSTIQIRTHMPDDERVMIWISDNGPGMTESVRQRLFDPFFTTKAVGKGTGMGLSISYQIVTERHGGALQCISAPGQGAEFAIEIPLRQSAR